MVGGNRLQLLSSRTFPHIVLPMIFEAGDTYLLRPMMRMTGQQFQPEGANEQKQRIQAREYDFDINRLEH
jgi:hypothetical protein